MKSTITLIKVMVVVKVIEDRRVIRVILTINITITSTATFLGIHSIVYIIY